MDIKKVMVAGAGVIGSQISWQIAYYGFNVSVYDAFEEGIEAGKKYHQKYAEIFKSRGASQEQVEGALQRLRYTTNLREAVEDVDIVSESVPESLDIKKKFYNDLSEYAPKKTIFTTNSSTMLPSSIASETDRPEKFLALHFANPVWEANIGEVMMHGGTKKEYFDIVIAFAKKIGLVPIPVYKEQNGYVLNSLLVPLLSISQQMYFDGVADYKDIDRAWMISTGAKYGPFGIIDLVGMQTVYNIALMNAKKFGKPELLARAEKIKKEFIDKGKMGISTGEGFYKYPNPEYKKSDFLK
jgi:3-hydroxybutyryl-CoA dehydrogenase